MRIHDFHIDGFGRFADRTVGPLTRPITVFFGPNEAGKSTYLQFIRTILFGFPQRLGKQHYPPLHGGSHGGRMTLTASDDEYLVKRVQGPRLGPVTVTASTGEILDEATLARVLGHQSKDVFENIFAFTLDELHSDDLLKDEKVNSQIYSAGMGVTTLPRALKQLADKRGGLFRKGGSNQEIAKVGSRLSEVESRLKEVADNAEIYGERSRRLAEVEAELQKLSQSRREIQSRLYRQQQIESAWSHWSDLRETEEQLRETSAIKNFPVDGVSRLEALEQRVETGRREYEAAQTHVEQAKVGAAVEIENRDILDHADAIRRLERGRTAFENSVRDLPRREIELRRHESDLANTLKTLGPDWDESQLEVFDLSIAVQDEISQFQEELRASQGEVDRCTAILTQTERELREAESERDRAEEEIAAALEPELDSEELGRRRGLIAAARGRLNQIDSRKQNASALQAQLDGLASSAAPAAQGDSGRILPAVSAAVIGVVILVLGALLGGAALLVGIIAGLALIGAGAYLYFSGVRRGGGVQESPLAPGLRDSLTRLEREQQDLADQLERDAASLGLAAAREEDLIAAERRLDEEERLSAERNQLSRSLKDAEQMRDQRSLQVEESTETREQARRGLEAVQQRWREWLRERDLRETFRPETAIELRGGLEIGRKRLDSVRDWQDRISKIRADISDYVDAVEPLAAAVGISLDRGRHDGVGAVADRLNELHAEVQECERARTAAERDLEEAERRLDERRRDLKQADEQLGKLLEAGGAADAEDFRQRAEIASMRAELEQKRSDAVGHLRRLSGSDEAFVALKENLAATDGQGIADERLRLEEEGSGIDSAVADHATEQGAIRQELADLIGEEESSVLRMERDVLQEQLRSHAREWAILTVAEQLLDEARGKFERDRQPGVVRSAESFFSSMTDQRYEQVFAPLGERTIRVTDADGRLKQPSELSRGTREQLFLSLRFGLIRDLGERTEPLPIIVDEVLVNFDPERALQAASAFVELSRTNQVLVFTCHPEIVSHFQMASAAAEAEEPEIVRIE